MRAAVCAMLAAVMLVPAAAPGAAAAANGTTAASAANRSATLVGGAQTNAAVDWVTLLFGAYRMLIGGGSPEAAIMQLIAVIQAAKTEIMAHIDRIATAEAKACAQQAIIDLVDINEFSTDTLQAYARDATRCVTSIESLLPTVTDLGSVDQLGFTVNAVGPVALAARARAGFSTAGLVQSLTNSNGTVLARLGPVPGACVPFRIEGQIEYYTCRAYNGDTGRGYPGQVAWDLAARNISWPVANVALAELSRL